MAKGPCVDNDVKHLYSGEEINQCGMISHLGIEEASVLNLDSKQHGTEVPKLSTQFAKRLWTFNEEGLLRFLRFY